ncbi:MAG: FtsH protease modulator HflK [Pseudomonadota bacterium]|jgi:membrane protease subunit HflK
MAWNEPGKDGKDPWGRRPNQGPPDLDEVVDKIQEKLRQVFGNGRSGNTPNNQDERGSFSFKKIMPFVFIAMVAWVVTGFYIVQPAFQGVETRFGKYTQTTQQGLNWHFPYPIEDVTKVNVEELRAIRHRAVMLTQDENIVEVELVVQYQVGDAKDYLFNVQNPDDTLHHATESALREVVGNSKMDDVLTSGRDVVAQNTKVSTQEILNRYKTGLTVRSINMQNAQPPEEVQGAFADVIKAREDEERSKNKADAYRNEVVQKAGGGADKTTQEAEAYRAQVIEHALGETRRFNSILAEYKKSPDITRQRMYLETVEYVLQHTSKVLVDTKQSNPLLVLPTDKLFGNEIKQPAAPLPQETTQETTQSTQNNADDSSKETNNTIPARSGRKDR